MGVSLGIFRSDRKGLPSAWIYPPDSFLSSSKLPHTDEGWYPITLLLWAAPRGPKLFRPLYYPRDGVLSKLCSSRWLDFMQSKFTQKQVSEEYPRVQWPGIRLGARNQTASWIHPRGAYAGKWCGKISFSTRFISWLIVLWFPLPLVVRERRPWRSLRPYRMSD